MVKITSRTHCWQCKWERERKRASEREGTFGDQPV